MTKNTLAVPAIVTALILSACQTTTPVATSPVANPLPPIEARQPVVGDQVVYLMHDGKQLTSRVVSVENDRRTSERDDGCSWTSLIGTFAPNPNWNNCSGSTGSQTATRNGDSSIYPLATGNTESWDVSGSNTNGNSWQTTRDCAVQGAVSITVPAGTFDTYHVRCSDKWWVRDSYVNADGIAVRWSRTRKVGSADRNRSGELVSFTPATS